MALWVPGWFHAFFVTTFLACRFFRENQWMTLIALGNAVLGLVLHWLPRRRGAEIAPQDAPGWAKTA